MYSFILHVDKHTIKYTNKRRIKFFSNKKTPQTQKVVRKLDTHCKLINFSLFVLIFIVINYLFLADALIFVLLSNFFFAFKIVYKFLFFVRMLKKTNCFVFHCFVLFSCSVAPCALEHDSHTSKLTRNNVAIALSTRNRKRKVKAMSNSKKSIVHCAQCFSGDPHS